MRQIIKFNDNWHFWKDVSDVNIQDGGENISLPHTWNGIDGQNRLIRVPVMGDTAGNLEIQSVDVYRAAGGACHRADGNRQCNNHEQSQRQRDELSEFMVSHCFIPPFSG